LSEGNIVIAQSAVSDVSNATNRGRLFGYIYMSASLAYVVGPLAGGKRASRAVVPWFSYMTPFWAMLFPLMVTLVTVALFFRETHQINTKVGIDLTAALYNLSAVFRPNSDPNSLPCQFCFLLRHLRVFPVLSDVPGG
jgi:MFS family permease